MQLILNWITQTNVSLLFLKSDGRLETSKNNKLKRGTCVTDFSEYIEQLSCIRGSFIIINVIKRRKLIHILDTLGLVQHI